MKKIVLVITIVLALVSISFACFEVIDYYNKKNKIDGDKSIINIEDKIHEIDLNIQEEIKIEEEIKLEKREKFEELELWKKKKKEIIESI